MKLFSFAPFLLCACLAAAFPSWGDSGIFDQRSVMAENARLEDAEEMLQQWLANHPEDQEVRFLLARIFAWQKKDAEAFEQYQHLLSKDPGNSDYLTGRAMLPVTTRPGSSIDQANPLGTSLPR